MKTAPFHNAFKHTKAGASEPPAERILLDAQHDSPKEVTHIVTNEKPTWRVCSKTLAQKAQEVPLEESQLQEQDP